MFICIEEGLGNPGESLGGNASLNVSSKITGDPVAIISRFSSI
jgi:hypothetical protein